MDYWGEDQRERALDAADEIRSALRYAPLNRNLRWALLDIYYDIAVADLAVAREKMVKAFQASLGIGVVAPPGEFLISIEIELLEEALPLYRKAIEGYFRLINDPMGVNVVDLDPNAADVPFGYYIFMQEVPQRSLFSPLFKDADGKWKLAPEDDKGDEILSGYKDLVLLFNVQRDYARAASQLSRRYILRSAPAYGEEDSDYDKALKLIGDVQQTCHIEGNVVLGIFPDYADENNGADSDSGLLESINSWRHELTKLSHLRTYANGETNLLGFTDDFLVLVQSVIPGDPQTQYFDSYNYFAAYLNNAASGGPLYNALGDWNDAKTDYENYRDRSDQLAMQFHNKTEQYNERLRQIVGVNPGEPGYDTPFDNEGSKMYLQGLNIDIAQKHIEANQQEIANLQKQVEIEIWRRGKEKGINNAIQQVYLDYGEKQMAVTAKIAEINAKQASANNMAAAAASVSATCGFPELSVTVSGGAIAYPFNAQFQEQQEWNKGGLQQDKEKLSAQEKADVHVQQDELLDVNSKAQIKTWLLSMNTLAIESAEAALVLVQEIGRLTALINEKEDLERRKAETNELLSDRYFADPSHRLLKDKSILRAELSFQRAQKWMFFTVRALEYKWNQKFKHYYQTTNQTYTSDTLLALRNTKELENMFDAMAEWDTLISIGARNDDGYKKFSFRQDFLGYRNGSQYFDPVSRELVEPWEAFQSYLGQESLYLGPDDPENPIPDFKVLKLTFSTAFQPESGGFFTRNRWLDKIQYLRVKVYGGAVGGNEGTRDGYLKYGGTSFIRNMTPGTPDPERPDRYIDEMTAYSTRHWYYDPIFGWQSKDAFGSPITAWVSDDPDVPSSVYQIDSFQEYSVATSEWTLYLAVESSGGLLLIDVDNITDIEIHFYYFWYARNLLGSAEEESLDLP